jgi:hypothetical protein
MKADIEAAIVMISPDLCPRRKIFLSNLRPLNHGSIVFFNSHKHRSSCIFFFFLEFFLSKGTNNKLGDHI